jgi:acetate kinase
VLVLVVNPGSNSLKAGIVRCRPGQRSASEGTKLVEVIVEGIGKDPKLSLYRGKDIERSESIIASNFEQASRSILGWLESQSGWKLNDLDCAGVRVVHGGAQFKRPSPMTSKVEEQITELAKWAPLHNPRSIEVLPAIRQRLPRLETYAVFDTSFHSTIPDAAGLYPIPLELSQKHGIRRYGFHGISHRYLMERYATLVEKKPQALNLVTMHLESGCSATAIASGRSIDNTMGLTPLEGLMMGTRSGDVDPSLPAFLAYTSHQDLQEVMEVLEKKSGLLGVSGKSLDTRVLMRIYDTDPRSHLAMEMFSYRLLKAVGAYLAVLGGADAVIFGGGIGENTALVRQRICEGLRWCGVEMDPEQNRRLIDIEGRLSTPSSPIQAYVIPAEETLQIAHECCQEHGPPKAEHPTARTN